MQERDMVRQQVTEPPIVIKTTGLSVEAKEMMDSIARRAYEIFESKGRARGHDLENWFEAESELFERTPVDLKESPEGVTVLADVRRFAPKELEVDLEPRRVTIIGKHQGQAERKTEISHSSEKRTTRLLRSLELPVEIDTRQATARLKGGVLELDVKKKGPAARAKAAQAGSGLGAA
jgi:HSP20 family protein